MRLIIFSILIFPVIGLAEEAPLILQPLGKSACYISESEKTVYALLVIRNISNDTHRIVTATDRYSLFYAPDSEIDANRGDNTYQVGVGFSPAVITLKSGEVVLESPAKLKILELPPGFAGALEIIKIPIKELEDERTFDESASFVFSYSVRGEAGKALGLWTGQVFTKEIHVKDLLKTR
ncbi:MAG: hypothetical protein AAGH72_11230 [Verrucomicrobiota bacterium]